MYEFITEKTIPEYEAFVQSHPKGNFAQSRLWGLQKPMWKWDAVAVRGADGKIKGTLALMTRKVPGIGRSLMYGCRGPVCDLDDRETFSELLAGAKELAKRTDISPFVRMAMIFQACRNSSAAFLKIQSDAGNGVQENAFLHNKYINYLITELKPVTGEIIRQGADEGLIVCQQPDALAEIVLLVLVVKLDNTLIPSTKEETEQTISELISLLEKGTDNPEGSLNFLRV